MSMITLSLTHHRNDRGSSIWTMEMVNDDADYEYMIAPHYVLVDNDGKLWLIVRDNVKSYYTFSSNDMKIVIKAQEDAAARQALADCIEKIADDIRVETDEPSEDYVINVTFVAYKKATVS